MARRDRGLSPQIRPIGPPSRGVGAGHLTPQTASRARYFNGRKPDPEREFESRPGPGGCKPHNFIDQLDPTVRTNNFTAPPLRGRWRGTTTERPSRGNGQASETTEEKEVRSVNTNDNQPAEAPQGDLDHPVQGNPGCSCGDGLCRDCAADYRNALDAIRELHQPIREGYQGDLDNGQYGYIEPACSTCGTDELAVAWPCPTIRVIDGGDL